MAMTDYFITCHKIERETASDGLGGYETVEKVGIEFMGLPVKKSETEQLVGALRGNEEVQYNFHCYANMPLKKDDVIMYEEYGVNKFLRLSSDVIKNTDLSFQTDWKSYNAESYVPNKIVGA